MALEKRYRQILRDLQLIKEHLGIQDDAEMTDQTRINRPEVQLTDAEREAIERAPKPRPDLRGLPESDNPVDADAAQTHQLDSLGLTADQSKALHGAGYQDRNSLRNATDAELEAVPGIGRATVRNLRSKL